MMRTRRTPPVTRRARSLLWCWVPFLAAEFAVASCTRDRPASAAHESAVSQLPTDTLGASDRIASDASLLVISASGAATAVRAVADSFAAYEAVQVVLEVGDARTPMVQTPRGEQTADVLVSARPIADTTAQVDTTSSSDPAGWRVRFASDSIATYSISLPHDAPSRALAERFLRFLLSSTGRTLLANARLHVPSAIVAIGDGIPPDIAALVDTTYVARRAP